VFKENIGEMIKEDEDLQETIKVRLEQIITKKFNGDKNKNYTIDDLKNILQIIPI